MGLGKTIQVVELLLIFNIVKFVTMDPQKLKIVMLLFLTGITYLTLRGTWKMIPGPHLIVCPASVLENWERELKKWCPSFSVLQYHGAGRAAYSKELSSLGQDWIATSI